MAINDISLTSGMRTNLVSLQSTVDLLNRTQERLSTGKKVNNALDNPLNFFTAQALMSRASDLAGFKDGMSEAVQTVKAANNGITAISALIDQAKAIAASAKTTTAGSNYGTETVTIGAGLAVGDVVTIGGYDFTAVASGATATQFNIGADAAATATNLATAITTQAAISAGSLNDLYVLGAPVDGVLTLASTAADVVASDFASSVLNRDTVVLSGTGTVGDTFELGGETFTAVASTTLGTNEYSAGAGFTNADSIASLMTSINANTTLGTAGISAVSTGTNSITLEATTVALAADSVTFTAATSSTMVEDSETLASVAASVLDASTANGASDRANYFTQYTGILTQIDNLATDSGYKGINLLAADSLAVLFGTAAADKLTVTGFSGSATGLGMTQTAAWSDNASIDADVTQMSAALTELKAQSSSLASGLSIVNTRQDWVKSMTNTLTQGADNLTLADMNEEGANMLMLQTRQSLGTTALSLSAQAAQSVLKLF